MIMKSYTDIEQSKKLAKILPIESADMHYNDWNDDFFVGYKHTGEYIADLGAPTTIRGELEIPCWSLANLLGVLPEIQGGKPVIALDDNYITYPHMSDLHTKADNLIDACVTLIIKLQEENLIT